MSTEHKFYKAYQTKLEDKGFSFDEVQYHFINELIAFENRLTKAQSGWFKRRASVEGIYLFGPVGRGKSFLMDIFIENSEVRIERAHFHEFMASIHSQLSAERQTQARDPLKSLAKEKSKNIDVLCLDEMQVENIADAMIIGRLFEAFFAEGVSLFTTSNRPPEDLYKNGLNRHRFTPFIQVLNDKTKVINLLSDKDYRLEGAKKFRIFENERVLFDNDWRDEGVISEAICLELKGRNWVIEEVKGQKAKIDFSDAFENARGAQDYEALAEKFTHIYIENIPLFTSEKSSAISRFITGLDIFFERQIALTVDLAIKIEDIHSDKDTEFVFERAKSRIFGLTRI